MVLEITKVQFVIKEQVEHKSKSLTTINPDRLKNKMLSTEDKRVMIPPGSQRQTQQNKRCFLSSKCWVHSSQEQHEAEP